MSESSLYANVLGQAGELNDQEVGPRSDDIREYLGEFRNIRVLLAASSGFGHQASSVNLLRALIRAWTPDNTTFSVYLYCTFPGADCLEQEETIRVLLPEFQELDEPFDLYGAEVTVSLLLPETQLPRGDFGISGGWDLSVQQATELLNVRRYIQLQPYAWEEGENAASVNGIETDLDEEFPEAMLSRRAFYLEEPVIEPEDWDAIEAGEFAEQGAIVRYLTEQAAAGAIEIVPVYGVATLAEGYFRLLNFVSVVLERQTAYKSSIPVVVIQLQTLSQADWGNFLAYVDDLDDEDLPVAPSAGFRAWHESAEVVRRVQVSPGPGTPPTLAALRAAVENLTDDQIYVEYLGPVPQVLYNFLYAQSSLPPVLEGQNTVELMLNLGRPYYKIGRRVQSVGFSYPTLPLGTKTHGPEARRSAALAGILNDVEPSGWVKGDPATYPPQGLLPMVDAYLNPRLQVRLARYFKRLGEFYHKTTAEDDEIEGKLFHGLDLLVQELDGAGLTARVQVFSLVAAGTSPLEDLYDRLVAGSQGGTLNLLAALTTGIAHDFFARFATADVFLITAPDPQMPGADLVTLTGNSAALGVPAALSFTFTQDGEEIATEFHATFTSASWMLAGAAWLSASSPSLGLILNRRAVVPVSGAFGARVTAGFAMDASVVVPSAVGVALFQGDFVDPRPSITNIFQMVGGINLQAYLPPQLQLIADMEVQNLELRYGYEDSAIEGIGINLSTPPDRTWQLVPGVLVSKLTLTATIDSPGDVATRTTAYLIGGEFVIVGGTGYVSAEVPRLRASGGLTEDSKPVTVAAFVKTYLGDGFAAALPANVAGTAISRLSFLVDQQVGTYSFAVAVTTEWKVPESGPLFTITGLGLSIQATSREINPPAASTSGATSGTGGATTQIAGTFTGSLVLLPDAPSPIGLQVLATYDSVLGWTFKASTTTVVSLGALLGYYLGGGWTPPPGEEYSIRNLALGISSSRDDSSWVFSGETAGSWVIPFVNVSLAARLKAGDAGQKARVPGKFGRLELDLLWHNVKITVWYDYNPQVQQFGITWGILEGVVSGPDPVTQDWTATLRFKESVTLGSMIEEMISWLTGSRFGLEAPWSVLNSIPLNGLALKYTFNRTQPNRNKVTFSIGVGPIDLGFARIDSIDVGYESTGPNRGVNVKLVGSFVWNTGANASGDTRTLGPWDASKPGAAPAPPGQGNKYLDLRLLAMGQHVTADCFPTSTTVQKAIECMGSLPPTEPGKLPNIRFDAESSWLIGADFGVLRLDDDGGGNGGGGTQKLAAAETGGTIPLGPETVAGLAQGEASVTVGSPVAGYVDGVAASAELSVRAQAEVTASSDVVPMERRESIGEVRITRAGAVPALALAGEAPAPAAGESKYFITLQVVFNDPRLYGLRIALDGAPAKIFKGLDFQIMYRQVSDTVGVYQAEITLPDLMRRLSIGAYTVTLPVFGIAVYTNGDFMLDVGFPWNEDFSRSFSIEGIIYPGIPVLGSAGFYFGKLSSATTDRVPRAINGTFNPVIVFGFGLQVGFGKSVSYGILSAGFSLTLVGILEGVIAKWNPYAITDGGGTDVTQVQGAYYFWLRGTVGIVGKLYGTVDFAIVKANVNVTIKLLLQLTYESFVSITITVIASVDVSVSVKIDLGLFSISIDFSFSMRIKESFSLKTDPNAPWIVDAGGTRSVLRAPAARRTRAFLLPQGFALFQADGAAPAPTWSNLVARPDGDKLPLTGWLAPGLTVARDEWQGTPTADQQVACYVAMLFIDSVPPTTRDTTTSALRAAGDAPDKPFETLAKMVFRWTVAAVQSAPHDAAYIDTVQLSDTDLAYLLDVVLVSSDANPTPIPPDAASEFMKGQFTLTAKLPSDGVGPDTTWFPVPGELKLTIPAYPAPAQPGGPAYPGYSYTFGGYNQVSQGKLKELRAYFDALAVQVQEEMDRQQPRALALDGGGLSMAEWMFSDYFLLLARQMTQAARDALRTFKYPIAAGDTPAGIVAWANATGQLTGDDQLTLLELFTANPTHPLNPSAGGPLTIGVTAALDAPASFAELAAEVGGGMTAALLAGANAAEAILVAGKEIRWVDSSGTGAVAYTVKAGDTLASITAALLPANAGFTFQTLLNSTDVTRAAGLLAQGGAPLVPATVYAVLAGDSFTTAAALPLYGSGFDAAALAKRNAGRTVLRAGAEVKPNAGDPYVVRPLDTLADVAAGLGMTVDQLLGQTVVLTQTDLLAPAAQLALPAFPYRPASKEETLESVAARFGVGVAVLADQPANGGIADLFSTTTASGDAEPFLDLAHLAHFPVGELLKEAQRSLALQQLSGMAARYNLHGLRIPSASGITPLTGGMWVRGAPGSYTLPAQAGLFALTGQQFPLPDLRGQTQPLSITFDRSAGPAWLLFNDAGGSATNTLAVDLKPGSTDRGDQWTVQRILNLTAFARAGRVDVALERLGAEPVVTSELSSYPLTAQVEWQSAGSVNLPYGTSTGAVQQLRLWTVPNAMLALPDPATRAVNPRFSVEVARYDEGTGATVRSAPGPYGWATVIPFTVKRVPAVAGSAAVEETYELVGADGGTIVLLERLLDQVQGDDGMIGQLVLGYAPDQAGGNTRGFQTDEQGAVTMGIAQVNLSTVTRPPSAGGLALFAVQEAPAPEARLLNTPTGFLRLVWEASITRAGGFYLYYYDAAAGRGLPDAVFNDRNETVVSVVVLWAPETADQQNRLTDYMTSVVTGEAIDTSSSVLFAQAAPPADPMPTVGAGAGDSLESLAYASYSDVGDLATVNAGIALSAAVEITVSEGVTQAPPGGISLTDLANDFGTSVTELQNANGGTLSDPVPFPTAVLLPTLKLTPGTSIGSGSLGAIAAYYGENLTALAAHNRAVKGLWAGQTVEIPGGPRVRNATVPPGVASVAALRTMPAPVPQDPTVPSYGQLAALNAYSLLQPTLLANRWFTNSGKDPVTGLAAGPVTVPADPDNADKIRAPRALAEGDDWDYRRPLPYAKFAQNPPADVPGLPPASASPYLGVGGVLQVTFDWLDYYGNALVTTLSTPLPGDPQPWNDPPVLTGYTDPIIGLSQWPSVSSSWRVAGAAGAAQLLVSLGFDPSRYQGLITASSPSSTTVTAVFTDALDPASATTLANYALAPAAEITAASLSGDGRTVTLTVPALAADEGYTLSADNLKLAGDTSRVVQGRAEFLGATVLSSTVQENASKDERVYTSLFYQLTDPQGIGYTISSPLLKAVRTDVPPAQVAALRAWLFTGGAPILGFVTDRAAFGTSAPVPAGRLELTAPVEAANDAQIFELWLDVGIARLGGAVAGDLETQPGIRAASTRVAPLQKALAGTAGAGSDGTLGLTEFATTYETALSGSDYRMTVATGTDRFETGSTASAAGSVWSVRLGTEAQQPIGYAVTAATEGDPDVYAPRPISNELQTRTGIPIRSYATGTGLSATTTPTDFSDIDMDVWGRTLFDAVDQLLTPQFTAAIQLAGELYTTPTDFLKEVLGEYTPQEVQAGKKGGKKSLAGIASEWMIPVFQDQAGAETRDVVEAFRQQLLVRLSNAYAVRAGVRFSADVWASVPEPVAPRLFGSVAPAGVSLQSATVQEDGASVVTLFFTGPLQPAPAGDSANYTVTDGPPATSATVSADATVVTLQMAGPVTAGTTQVTVGAAVKDAAGRPLRAPTTRVVTVGAADLASTISYTSPRVTLRTGTQPLPFLVTAPEIVLGSTGEVVSSVPMDLAYEGSSIEHQIGSLDGIDGYQASSWLSFVVPASRAPLRAELGAFELPMVLRSFPATPTLPSQAGTASAPDCGVPLAELTEWDYRFTYSLPFHYPQDRVHALVEFNLRPPPAMFAALEDAFAQMAQFVTVIPQVQADFDAWLAGIDATTDPVKDAEKVKNAAVALQSFITMVDDVVYAADGNALAMVATAGGVVGDAALDYAFTVDEGAVDVGATQGALRVTLLGALPAGIAGVTVEIDPANYTAQPYAPGGGAPPADAFSFVYLKNGTPNEYLTAADGQALPDRTVVLRGMDVLQRQDAWSTVQVKRNETLAGREVAEPFVYTTPQVKFADPLFPTLSQDCPIDLSLIGSADGNPVPRPLDVQLNMFFDQLLARNTQPTLTFQVEVTYEYHINPQLGPVQLPVIMQAPLTVQVSSAQGDTPPTREQMVEQWTQAITRWFTAYTPACGGTLKLDLTAMSDLTQQPMPLLRLSNLQLPTAWVQNPPLPCLQNAGRQQVSALVHAG